MTTTKKDLLNICNAAGMEMMKHPENYTKETKDFLWKLIKICLIGSCDTELIIDEVPF